MIPRAIENGALKVTSDLASPRLGILLKLAMHQSFHLNLRPIRSESILPLEPHRCLVQAGDHPEYAGKLIVFSE